MLQCFIRPSDFKHTCAVIVTRDGINLRSYSSARWGWLGYFHVAGSNDLPKFMSESGCKRYLTETGKKEIRRWIVPLPNPAGAHQKLGELLAKQ